MELKSGTQIKIDGKTAVITNTRHDRGTTYYKAFIATPKPLAIFGAPAVGQYAEKIIEFQQFHGEFRRHSIDRKTLNVEINDGEGVDLEAWNKAFEDVYSSS